MRRNNAQTLKATFPKYDFAVYLKIMQFFKIYDNKIRTELQI